MTVFWASNLAWGAILVWDPNTEPDLAGYRVYFKEQASSQFDMVDVGLETRIQFDQLNPGVTYQFYATAYNLAGLESGPSEMVTYTVPAAALQLEWEKSPHPEVANYEIYYGEVNRATKSIPAKKNLSLSLAGLLPGKTYYFYAIAFDASGAVLDRYKAITFQIPEGETPGGLRLKRENKKPGVRLASPSPGGTYMVSTAIPLRVTASDEDGTIGRVDYYVSTTLIASSDQPPFSANWKASAPGTYYFTAIAVDNEGAVGVSPVETVTIEAAPLPPSAPGQIAAVGGDGMVRIDWPEAERAESYNVYRAISWSGPFQRIASVEFPVYLDQAVVNGTRYFYQVTAENSQGESDPSPMAMVTPLPALPAAPASLSAGPDNGSVLLSWPASARASSYLIERASSWSGPFVRVGTTGSMSFTDATVMNGTRYYYQVYAQNAAGVSGPSPMAAVVPVIPAPEAPESLRVAAVEGGVKLTWGKVAGATTYEVLRAMSVAGPYGKVGSTAANSYTDADVSAGESYYYRVTAVNASGSSRPSATTSAQIPAPVQAPEAPTTITASGKSGGVALSWPSMDRATDYHVYRSTSFSGPFEKTGTVQATFFTDVTGEAGNRYFYYVTAQNSGGESQPSPMTFVVLW